MSETPPMTETLRIKLASLVVHCEEMLSPDGREADKTAVVGLIEDVEVRAFIDGMDPVFLPVKRGA